MVLSYRDPIWRDLGDVSLDLLHDACSAILKSASESWYRTSFLTGDPKTQILNVARTPNCEPEYIDSVVDPIERKRELCQGLWASSKRGSERKCLQNM